MYIPYATNMRIPFKHLRFQPSFPEMDGSSNTTDTRANDAYGLDVEALISHVSSKRLYTLNLK
jgi:hypothetical protein